MYVVERATRYKIIGEFRLIVLVGLMKIRTTQIYLLNNSRFTIKTMFKKMITQKLCVSFGKIITCYYFVFF